MKKLILEVQGENVSQIFTNLLVEKGDIEYKTLIINKLIGRGKNYKFQIIDILDNKDEI